MRVQVSLCHTHAVYLSMALLWRKSASLVWMERTMTCKLLCCEQMCPYSGLNRVDWQPPQLLQTLNGLADKKCTLDFLLPLILPGCACIPVSL